MAYFERYNLEFTNDLNQTGSIRFYKKDEDGDIITYEAENIILRKQSANSSIFDPIVGTELLVQFDQRDDVADYWDEFVNAAHDTWKVIAEVDGEFFFHGFVIPDEGTVPLIDRPYSATIRAACGLGLLKEMDFTQANGDPFKGQYTWIEYLAGALKKTGLDLHIRIYDDVYHTLHLRRDTSIDLDMWSQTYLIARTFEKDANEMLSCYEAIERLLADTHRIFYHRGEWVVQRTSMLQFRSNENYFTVYYPDASIQYGDIDDENFAEVGKGEVIWPQEQPLKSAKFAARLVKHTFRYEIPINLVDNIRLQELGDFIAPLSGVGYSAWEMVNWTQYQSNPTTLAAYAGTKNAYIKSEYDANLVETARYYNIEYDSAATGDLKHHIRHDNEDFYVYKGDKITPSINVRLALDEPGVGFGNFGKVILFTGGDPATEANYWSLKEDGTWENNQDQIAFRKTLPIFNSEWITLSLDETQIPEDGILYLYLGLSGDISEALNSAQIQKIELNYQPFINGGLSQVTGDYHQRTNGINYQSTHEKEVYVSDTLRPSVKGAIFRAGGIPTTPEWYRYGESEQKSYKDLTNLGIYNLLYRRFWKIEGDFVSIFYAPQNNDSLRAPIALHKVYRFVDLPTNRDFILAGPVELNLLSCDFSAVFVEVKEDSFNDGQENGTPVFNYMF